jgi:hypothetical protein
MKRIVIAFVLAGFAAFAIAAEEKSATTRVASVGLFKNGLAVVQRTVTVNGPGVYRVEDVPTPVHGTFWVESDAKVSTRLTRRVVEVSARQASGTNFQEELAGKEVVIHFTEQGVPPAMGTVAELDPHHGDEAWDRAYQQPQYGYYPYNSDRRPGGGRMLVLTHDSVRSYVDPSRIAFLQAKEAGQKVKQRKPVMLFTVSEMKDKTATIAISYLTKGMAWAPSYRVDISDHKTLSLQQQAVIKNELEPIEDARVRLISGFPSVQFANVTSPLSLNTTWSSFFQQLNQRFSEGSAALSNRIISQNSVSFNDNMDRGMDLSAVPSGDGVDLHYQDIGPQTMGEGDSLALETASAKAAYDRIVEWVVPDTRRADGVFISEGERDNDPEKYRDAAWDAVRFRNPLSFPMTTAPAMIVADGRFNGQRLSYWVNPGEETTLHVTKALSIRTRSTEQEIGNNRETVYIGGNQYRKASVDGELRANNHRKEAVTMVIRRRFSGDLVSADQSPKQTLLEEGVYSVNKRNQLLWSLTLKPGEEVRLNYRYTVLVRF